MSSFFPPPGTGITIVEVGPRDGLQNEPEKLTVQTRVKFVRALAAAGLKRIEAASFVHPKWIPSMAGAAEVMAGLRDLQGVQLSALTPNLRGLEDGLKAGLKEAAVFTSASETHCQKNINCSIEESFERFLPVAERCREAGVRMRGYVSVVAGCPYEGDVEPEQVARLSKRLIDEVGCFEVSLGDTVGVGTPSTIWSLLHAHSEAGVDRSRLALHLHDTRGTALANVLVGLSAGIRTFDSSAGGLGGCPYAPGATGNLATEDLVYMLEGMGLETGVNLAQLTEATAGICQLLGRRPPSRTWRALRPLERT
ncbi:MAG: hydroxymethylglutaryl-CoA lyase [Myxococcales bacterium]|nr:hydroxymethylglutaryl-CoA lyase [Myxococcales bacterium]